VNTSLGTTENPVVPGYVDRASGFTKSYKADYLFPHPEVMGISHFPEDQAWQLRS